LCVPSRRRGCLFWGQCGVRENGWRCRTEIQFFPVEYFAAVVVGVEVHVESVDVAVAFVVHDDCGGDGVVGLSASVWLRAFDPFGIRGHVVVGSKVDIVAQLVDIFDCQRLRGAWDFVEVHARRCMIEKGLDISGKVFIVGVEVDDRRWYGVSCVSCSAVELGKKQYGCWQQTHRFHIGPLTVFQHIVGYSSGCLPFPKLNRRASC